MMRQSDFEGYVKHLQDKSTHTLVEKGREYAGSEDRLSNFKRGALLTGTTELQTALIYMAKHFDSICTYVRDEANSRNGVRPMPTISEPIEDRFVDLMNYAMLMAALVHERYYSNKVDAPEPGRWVKQ